MSQTQMPSENEVKSIAMSLAQFLTERGVAVNEAHVNDIRTAANIIAAGKVYRERQEARA